MDSGELLKINIENLLTYCYKNVIVLMKDRSEVFMEKRKMTKKQRIQSYNENLKKLNDIQKRLNLPLSKSL